MEEEMAGKWVATDIERIPRISLIALVILDVDSTGTYMDQSDS
jgi:hypothetical protein